MTENAYLRTPAIAGDVIAFVTEDDLWTVPADGGVAVRFTAMRGEIARPAFSPDGALLAFSSKEEHHLEVYVAPASGGAPKRLTFLGATSTVVGWTQDGDIVFKTDHATPFLKETELWAISPRGGEPRRLPHGLASEIAYGPKGKVALGRNTIDPARWKRYRGGTAGHLWVDARGKGRFVRLPDLGGNLAHPMWVGERVFFVSDHEGIGNIYSCAPDGKDVQRHTDHDEYYARFASTDGRRIAYQHAADIWVLDPAADDHHEIDVSVPSSRTQRARKFVPAERFLQGFAVHPEGHSVALEVRGKLFSMPLWEGAVTEHGDADGVRYRFGQWLHDGERLAVISDASGEEQLEILGSGKVKRLKADVGRPIEMLANPATDHVAIANHRHELVLVDVKKGAAIVIDRSAHGRVEDLAFSPDGTWLAYSIPLSARTRSIKLYDIPGAAGHQLTRPEFADYAPAFDPKGRWLFFLSRRTFDPVYDAHFFDLSFPKGSRPYVVTLQAEARSPLVPEPRGLGAEEDEEKKRDESKKPWGERVRIDIEGIGDRIVSIPVPESDYRQIAGVKGDRAVFTSFPVRGSLDLSWYDALPETATLEMYDFSKQRHETLTDGVVEFTVARDAATLVYRALRGLRAVKAGEKPESKNGDNEPGRRSGWLDLKRLRVSVDPATEWRQMFGEIWRLQRDHFWTSDMSGIDWPAMRERYRPLVERVSSRTEFSDLIWEFQGELGTSHAYEIGGDYRPAPQYPLGHLGADLSFDRGTGLYTILRIVRGDAWEPRATSPLLAPGVNVREGETILAVNGRRCTPERPPQALLVNQAGQMVELTIGDAKGAKPRTVLVQTMEDERPARYRAWVEAGRAHVHKATRGRAGYVHIPNMGPLGWSEFHRYYLSEVERDALVVDVRFNGGGHVSEIILEKLARKRIAYGLARWGVPEPYPADSVFGPMVCLTNEQAGSDGDIFTHAFKLMKLGPVVGKRTWGGVVGIWPRHHLADGSVTTQPEFHTWFTDVGWGLENYGTDPDHDVDITPQDHAAGRDPQMATALKLLQDALKAKPPKLPSLPRAPSLRPGSLPPRKGFRKDKRG